MLLSAKCLLKRTNASFFISFAIFVKTIHINLIQLTNPKGMLLSALKKTCLSLVTITLLQVESSFAASNLYWEEASITGFNSSQERQFYPEQYRALHLDINAIRAALALAPKEFTVSHKNGLQLAFPLPDGTFKTYSVVETEVMHPQLAAKYPLIKTYVAQGIDDPYSWMRLDLSYLGFHAMISTLDGFVFIDPLNNTEPENYLCYYKKEMPDYYGRHCDFVSKEQEEERIKKELNGNNPQNQKVLDSGDELRTYRLAMACTGEYAATKGGTVPGALSGIVTSVNRVNGIYEIEVAVRMVLIPNTDTLIFLNASSDPYTNSSGGAMLGQNQTTVDTRIGIPNYDFGHVFSTGGGGIAGLGVICNSSSKANGVTGLPNPVGDPFDVDYVAHEMGHQFSGNHTFNSNTQGSCAGNASPNNSYEPGSGSTIMAYAGICASHDLQANSDVLFHAGSYFEITNFTIASSGNSCAFTNPTTNTVPVINPLNDYIIPFKTPFILTGSAYDLDGDPLTYIWEQFDLGPFGGPNTPTGNAPTFRDFVPTIDSTRTFPKLTSIINNTNITGERLPTYARTMTFRFTARDNRIAGGGVAYSPVNAVINVINTTNPFQVTVPNVNSVLWHFGDMEQVTWDVSSTDLTPINCANVNIRLSLDGGFTFPYVLAANTPNDGTEMVLVSGSFPTTNTANARIKVEAVGNIFFDMSNANFAIQQPNSVESLSLDAASIQLFPNPVNEKTQVTISSYYTGKLTVLVTDFLGRTVLSKEFNKKDSELSLQLDLSFIESGTYFMEVKAASNSVSKRFIKL
jgi:Metallo-peptidase family M12B Reprolysin-like/Secretion system C-terminal sorting domain